MIYRNTDLARNYHWSPDSNPEAGSIARHFLAGEYDLLRFTRATGQVALDLGAFLDLTEGSPLDVSRAPAGEVLITARVWNESLLVTGRTADVLCGYLDQRVVRMADRFDMTMRQAVRVSV